MAFPNPGGHAPPSGYVTSSGRSPVPFQQLGKSIDAMIPSTNGYWAHGPQSYGMSRCGVDTLVVCPQLHDTCGFSPGDWASLLPPIICSPAGIVPGVPVAGPR
jgi:hypothetical protein